MRVYTQQLFRFSASVVALPLLVLVACGSSGSTPPATAGGSANGAQPPSGAGGTTLAGAAGASSTSGAGANLSGANAGGTVAQGGAGGVGGAASTGGAGFMQPPIAMGSLEFTRKTLHLFNYAEGIGIGDFNADGRPDVHSGPFWWEGPAFDVVHQFFPLPPANGYTDMTLGDWADYEYDVDQDGWLDSINIMRPSTPSYWYKNPGKPGLDAAVSSWAKSELGTLVLEQSMFGDLTGEGKPQLVCAIDSMFGFFDMSVSSPWAFNPIAPSGATNAYAWWHGIGIGDLDGDAKPDLLTDHAWFTRPAGGPRAGLWAAHSQRFKGDNVADEHGPSQMYGYDVDGDGDQDVITALDSHGYGVAWYENLNGSFLRHVIVGDAGSMATNAGMIAPFSQPHALVVADIDGDGLKDIVTGKSFYAHPPGMGDPDADGTPVFYVFKLVRTGKVVSWEPHLVDSEEGLGRQFATGDLNGDGKVDIAVAGKHGAFLFFQ
jgi:hypothetical protein